VIPLKARRCSHCTADLNGLESEKHPAKV